MMVHRFPGSFMLSKTIINSQISISNSSFFGDSTIAIQALFDFIVEIFSII